MFDLVKCQGAVNIFGQPQMGSAINVKEGRDWADQAIALAARRTGIGHDAVLICPSHNHSSPLIPVPGNKTTPNNAYLDALPERIATSVVQANEALQPARMSIGRSLVYEGHVNRRVISKADGLALNTWLKKLDDLEQVPQDCHLQIPKG